jgi:hypothetical protein
MVFRFPGRGFCNHPDIPNVISTSDNERRGFYLSSSLRSASVSSGTVLLKIAPISRSP